LKNQRNLGLLIAVILVFVPPAKIIAQENPNCTTPAGENRFGAVTQFGWKFLYQADRLEQALVAMNEAGIGWARLNWAWKDMQPEEGPFDFSHYDMIAQLAAEYEVEILPILFAIPAWASTAPEELKAERGNLSPVDRYRPIDLEAWLNYVRVVVERYDGDGIDDAPDSPRMNYWELWNEPNISLFWPPEPDTQEYADLLKATHAAIKSADPTAKIVLGGLVGSGVRADGTGFLPDLYAAGAGEFFDVVSIHVYVHPVNGGIEFVQTVLENTRAVMDINGDEGKPIWLTEIGWSDAENAWGQPTASLEDIAAFLTDVYTTPLPAEIIFWYSFQNIFDDSPDVEHNFGLLNADFSPKPAYEALKIVTAGCR
jgi:GH35 family endo-1,4-beta-xylanase